MHYINRACIFMGCKFSIVEYLNCEYFNLKHFKHIFIIKNSTIHIHHNPQTILKQFKCIYIFYHHYYDDCFMLNLVSS